MLGTPKITKVAGGKGVLVELTSPFLGDPEILSDFLKTSKVIGSEVRTMVAIDDTLIEALDSIDIETMTLTTIEDQ